MCLLACFLMLEFDSEKVGFEEGKGGMEEEGE